LGHVAPRLAWVESLVCACAMLNRPTSHDHAGLKFALTCEYLLRFCYFTR